MEGLFGLESSCSFLFVLRQWWVQFAVANLSQIKKTTHMTMSVESNKKHYKELLQLLGVCLFLFSSAAASLLCEKRSCLCSRSKKTIKMKKADQTNRCWCVAARHFFGFESSSRSVVPVFAYHVSSMKRFGDEFLKRSMSNSWKYDWIVS